MTQRAIGKPAPLGAHYDGQGVNFTLFSAHAERVELCVFDANGQEHRYDLPGHSGDIWHGYLPDARPGLRYGYRVHGPWQPAEGWLITMTGKMMPRRARRGAAPSFMKPMLKD